MADPLLRIQIGCTAYRDKDDLAEVRRQTHDWLIEEAGDARIGPVEWRHWPAPAGLRVMRDIGMDQERADVMSYLRAHPGGMLVIASVQIDPDLLPPDERDTALAEAQR